MKVQAKRWLTMLLMVSCALMLLFGLAACGGDSGPGEDAGVKDGVFTGRVPRDIAEFDAYVQKAREASEAVREYGEDEQAELAQSVNETFLAGNASYKDGDFGSAEQSYKSVLGDYDRHFGSNVNLALAELQQGKTDDALVQALECVFLYPDEGKVVLNVQTAAVACGFSLDEVDGALDSIIGEDGSTSLSAELSSANATDDYEYNRAWDEVEVNLKALADRVSGGDLSDTSELADLVDKIWMMDSDSVHDSDIFGLREYVAAVGTQLGYGELHAEDLPADVVTDIMTAADKAGASAEVSASESADASSSSASESESSSSDASSSSSSGADIPHLEGTATSNTVPFLVAETEYFDLKITHVETGKKDATIEYELKNKSSDYRLRISVLESWTVNDKAVGGGVLDQPIAEPDSTELGSIIFTDGKSTIKGPVESFSGTILVQASEVTGPDDTFELASYALHFTGN